MNLAKTSSKRKLLVVTIVGFALCTAFIFYLYVNSLIHNNPAPISVYTATIPKPEKVNFGLPVRLKIPTIKVNTALDYVGLTPGGDLDVPKGPVNAGWYDQGPRPGAEGNAVIDGHFGYKNHIPAVFDNLHKLQAGDSIYVVDDRGATIAFVVRDIQMYDQNASESAVFVSNDGKAHLNLITCQGTWNKAQKSYSNRLVVFADKEI